MGRFDEDTDGRRHVSTYRKSVYHDSTLKLGEDIEEPLWVEELLREDAPSGEVLGVDEWELRGREREWSTMLHNVG